MVEEGRPVNVVGQTGSMSIQTPEKRRGIGNKIIEGTGHAMKPRFVPTHGDDLGVGKLNRNCTRCPREPLAVGKPIRMAGELQRSAQEIHTGTGIGHGKIRWPQIVLAANRRRKGIGNNSSMPARLAKGSRWRQTPRRHGGGFCRPDIWLSWTSFLCLYPCPRRIICRSTVYKNHELITHRPA